MRVRPCKSLFSPMVGLIGLRVVAIGASSQGTNYNNEAELKNSSGV